MLPTLIVETSMSAGIAELTKGARLWNQYARAALRGELDKHHALRIPRHFRLGAAAEYGYERRKLSTFKKKKYFWRKPGNLDLVRSGQSSRTIIQRHSVSFGGAIGSPSGPGVLQGRLNMLLPYAMRSGKTGGITPEEIKAEITSTTEAERQQIAHGFTERLIAQVTAYAGPMKYLRRSPDAYGSRRRSTPVGGMFTSGAHGPGF